MDREIWMRQTGIIDPDKLQFHICIIGAGSIGGWTALCLGKLGCRDITVMDFDNVETHNAGSQLYKSTDAGMRKVDALKNRLEFLLEAPIAVKYMKWTPEEDLREYDIVIAATDNITVRKEIFEHLAMNQKTYMDSRNRLYIDARMASNAIEIYTVLLDSEENRKFYESTLFDEKDTLPIPCSERSVVYNVFSVASWIGNYIAKYANKSTLPQETIIDLANMTLFT